MIFNMYTECSSVFFQLIMVLVVQVFATWVNDAIIESWNSERNLKSVVNIAYKPCNSDSKSHYSGNLVLCLSFNHHTEVFRITHLFLLTFHRVTLLFVNKRCAEDASPSRALNYCCLPNVTEYGKLPSWCGGDGGRL